MAPTFAYWDLRGLGQAVRFILEYTGEAYDEKVYCLKQLPDGSVDREDWLKEKFTLGLDFPNLPYYIDGDLKITQSRAILHHIGNKHGLSGSNNQEKAMINMLESEAYDYRFGFALLCYDEKFEEKKSGYLEGVKPKLEVLSKFLGNKEFLMGKITTADFMMYESLYCINKLSSALIDSHKNLKDYLARFAALPKIKEYMASKRYIGSPMNAPMAKFGGQKE